MRGSELKSNVVGVWFALGCVVVCSSIECGLLFIGVSLECLLQKNEISNLLDICRLRVFAYR